MGVVHIDEGKFRVYPIEDEEKIHPHYLKLNIDIISFMANKRFCVGQRHIGPGANMLWDLINPETDIIETTIALTSETAVTIYYLNGKEFTQQEMLRIIKLKAFL